MATTAATDYAAFWVGTSPSVLVFDLDSDVDLSTVTTTAVVLADPVGVAVPGSTAVLDSVESSVAVTLPPDPFTLPGTYLVRLTLTGTGFVEVVDPVRLIVQADDGWLSLQDARNLWPQAPEDDVVLSMLLNASLDECLVYLAGPEGPAVMPTPIPDRYRQAQFQQARSTWLAMSATQDSQVGDEQFAVTVFPLDWHVKQLLRPRGLPVIF